MSIMQSTSIRNYELFAIIIMALIYAVSCADNDRAQCDSDGEPVTVETNIVKTDVDTIKSKSDSLTSSSRPNVQKLSTDYQNDKNEKEVFIDLYYCHITNPVLANILKEQIAKLSASELKKQKFASMYYGIKIDFEPVKIYPSHVNWFKKNNYYTLINDSIGVFIHCGYYEEFMRSWIEIDSAKTQKCKISVFNFPYNDYDDCDDDYWGSWPDVEYIPYVISKKDSGKVAPTQSQLDSIAYEKKVRSAFE